MKVSIVYKGGDTVVVTCEDVSTEISLPAEQRPLRADPATPSPVREPGTPAIPKSTDPMPPIGPGSMLIDLSAGATSLSRIRKATRLDLQTLRLVPVDIHTLISGNPRIQLQTIRDAVAHLETNGMLQRRFLDVHVSRAQLARGLQTHEIGALFERQAASPGLDGILVTVDSDGD